MTLICCCSLAGTEACYNCPEYIKHFGKRDVNIMSENIICKFKDKCSSYPNFCSSCSNNTGKKNYYIPEQPYNPIVPYTPWIMYPYVTCGTSDKTNHYQST